jgi:glycosyltransferase involved in cell wall biosynthesis
MPVYNAEKYLREAIDSVLAQTYTNFELLLINDGSKDSSKDIILSYHDPRIRYVENEKNLKLIATLNKGIDLAAGDYIARMDSDDVISFNRLEIQMRLIFAPLLQYELLHVSLAIHGCRSELTTTRRVIAFRNRIMPMILLIVTLILCGVLGQLLTNILIWSLRGIG